ncbi:MAG TPA: PHP domain-containing protein [Acidimicrobiales bacterium]|nr:PHP domain-containing protein [Acidimicrobiales bacterium]
MIDLHTHSTVSDGSDAPEAIPGLAAAAGCTAVALTDHDRLDGIDAARTAAAATGVELVPGCELSCEIDHGTMHVLVYFVEPGEGPLQDELVRLQRVRDRRNVIMCERLDLSYDDLQAEAGGIGAGRPHAAALLVRAGRAESIQDAFDRWLAKGRPGYVEKERLTPVDALSLARASGGVPVLAHPLTLDVSSATLESRVHELARLGLGGLEAIYARYSPETRAALVAMARRAGLAVTGGSDHHGTYKPGLSVGAGTGDLAVPDDLLDRLRDRIAA